MVVGVPKEIKVGEQRVALTPAGARAFTEAGHRVLVEANAGGGSGFRDDDYARAGAVVTVADGVWSQAELVLKVKEPLPDEVARIRDGQILFTYLHLAAVPELIRGLQARKCIAIAYETVARADGSLPLLTPMSEVAGRLAVQEGAHHLGEAYGGRGILLSGIPGVPHGNVAILGAGTVGLNATKMALGYGADVSLLDINLDRLRHADHTTSSRCFSARIS
jgi:alanine dehydrogenase